MEPFDLPRDEYILDMEQVAKVVAFTDPDVCSPPK